MSSRSVPLWRSLLSWLFLLLFWVAAPVALVTTWARVVVSDEAAYTTTVAAVADNPKVQSSLAEATTRQIMRAVTGDNPTATAAVQARQMTEMVEETSRQIVASRGFRDVWTEANRQAFRLLTSGLAAGRGEPIMLDLSPLAEEYEEQIELLDAETPVDLAEALESSLEIEVLDAQAADQLRAVVQQLMISSWGSLAIALLAALLAVALAGNRLATLARLCFGLAVSMAALIALLLLGQGIAAAAVPDPGGQVALEGIADAVTQGLRLAAIAMAVVSLLLAAIFAGLNYLSAGERRG